MKLTYLPDSEEILVQPGDVKELRGIKNWFDRYVEGYAFNPAYKNKLWNGKRTRFNSEKNTLPMGLWKEIYKCCQEFQYPIEFTNKKEFPINRDLKEKDFQKFVEDFFKGYMYEGKQFELRDYQIRVAYNILKNRYCNISVATSGGKTLIYALVLFYLLKKHPKERFLLVVPSKTLVTQFYNDLQHFNWNDEVLLNVCEIFGEEEKPRTTYPGKQANLCIGTFQSLSNKDKYDKKFFQQFFSITTDEGHKSASVSYKKILKQTYNKAYYRWGMSGTFPTDDSYEMMEIMAKTGPVVDIVKARELMDKGFITQVKIKGILLNHNNWDFVDTLEIVASRDKKSAYDLEVEKIQESTERLDVVNKIVSQCKANTLVLFHNTDYGKKLLEHLKEMNPDKEFHYIDGSVKENGSKKNPENCRNWIKKEMEKTDKVKILVASFGTLSTGVSIKSITNIIFTQSFKKEQVIIQSIGRALRLHPDKNMAYIFDLVDVFQPDYYAQPRRKKFKNILLTHWEKRLKIYSNEQYPVTFMKIDLINA